MAWREGRKRSGEAEGFELRARPQDRVGGPPKARSDGPLRRRDAAPPRETKKRKRGSKSRSGFGRLFYWAFVLALWGLIAGIAVLVWVGIHLPPIQSLEIPKRPPSVLILGSNGATWRRAATWVARRCRCPNCRTMCPRPSLPSRTAASI